MSVTKMYGIKRENEEQLCRGCLSIDRSLSPLTNYDLYFTLLGNTRSVEEVKFVDILLCWECLALLQRTQAFRCRLQFAHTLSLTLNRQLSPNTLSTLKFTHKQDYDYSIEDTLETKSVIDQFKNNGEIDIKEEYDVDAFENDNYSENNDVVKEELKTEEVKIKRNYRSQKEKKHFQRIDNPLDLNVPEKYFSQLCLTEREIGKALERERDGDTIGRPHKCGLCGFRFLSKTLLYNHKRNFHTQRNSPGKCQHCDFRFKSLWDLEMHCWQSHPVNRCTLCGYVVGRERDRALHLHQLHRFRYRCMKCMVDFDNKQSCSYHEKQLHSKYFCDHCGQRKSSRNSLEKHIMRKHLPNKCPSCPLVFASREALGRHARGAHAGERAYCVECDASFPSRAKYQRHLRQALRHRPHDPPAKISVPCPECGKVFSRKNYMNNHMKLFHSNQSRHHCQRCDKYFVTGFSLRSHNARVHEKIPVPKTKICSVCGRGFGTNRVLENHMRTHTGERPFACAHCSAAFAQRVALRAHLAAIHKQK